MQTTMIIEQLKTALKGSAFADRYELQKLLGAKPGRYTFLSRDRTTNEPVVTKIFLFDNNACWDDYKLFEREAQTLQHISHRAIPAYLDYLEIDLPNLKGFVLVQSYIKARSLDFYLKEQITFDETQVRQIALRLLQTLVYLQQFNPPIIHRDIKPSNILLGDRTGNSIGEVYLIDFGSVQNIAAVEAGTITIVGTYGYMPPEQFSGKTTTASDIYSLGVTLICLLTGKHPSELPQENLRIQFAHLTDISPAFSKWLDRAIAPNYESRFSSAKSALSALEKLIKKFEYVAIKPAKTDIVLLKDRANLQILFSKLSLQSPEQNRVYLIEYLKCCGGVLILPALVFVFWGLKAGLSVFSLVAILMLVCFCLNILTKTKIKFDYQNCQVSREIFGYCFSTKYLFSLKDVIKIERIIPVDSKGKHFDNLGVDTPGLIIWVEDRAYSLRKMSDKKINFHEAHWLGLELSNWLDVPLSYICFQIH